MIIRTKDIPVPSLMLPGASLLKVRHILFYVFISIKLTYTNNSPCLDFAGNSGCYKEIKKRCRPIAWWQLPRRDWGVPSAALLRSNKTALLQGILWRRWTSTPWSHRQPCYTSTARGWVSSRLNYDKYTLRFYRSLYRHSETEYHVQCGYQCYHTQLGPWVSISISEFQYVLLFDPI